MRKNKNQSFLEAGTIIFGGHNQACPKYPKQQDFAIVLQYLKNEGRQEVDFLHADKQTFLKVDTINIGYYGWFCPKCSKQQVFKIFVVSRE